MGSDQTQMSARKLPLVLSARAQRDVHAILVYTHNQWGAAKRLEYREILYKGLAELQAFPEMGRPREDIAPGLRGFPVGRYAVYYTIRDTDRVVHMSREVGPGDLVDPDTEPSR